MDPSQPSLCYLGHCDRLAHCRPLCLELHRRALRSNNGMRSEHRCSVRARGGIMRRAQTWRASSVMRTKWLTFPPVVTQ
eukprot:scaffold10581_cov117-Isochrysis_galbana.AAC.11